MNESIKSIYRMDDWLSKQLDKEDWKPATLTETGIQALSHLNLSSLQICVRQLEDGNWDSVILIKGGKPYLRLVDPLYFNLDQTITN